MIGSRLFLTLSLVSACVLLAANPGAARVRHRRASVPAAPAPAAPRQFYPNNIEGGVTGNLSFNNQIRKHTDPLGANGGK